MWEQSDIDSIPVEDRVEGKCKCVHFKEGIYWLHPFRSWYRARRFQKTIRLFGKYWIISDFMVGNPDGMLQWELDGDYVTPKIPKWHLGIYEAILDMRNVYSLKDGK